MLRHPTDRTSLERDCIEEHVRSGGPGGQHKNKRETGVRLTHRPTGTVVTATERRSQSQNREVAYVRMARRLDALQRPRKRRRPTRPGRGAIERRLKSKRQRAQTKALRGKPDHD